MKNLSEFLFCATPTIAEYGQFEAKIDQLRRDLMSGGAAALGAPRRELFVRYY